MAKLAKEVGVNSDDDNENIINQIKSLSNL